MSDLNLKMHPWSNEGETVLVGVEISDKFDNNTVSVDCAQEQFRTIERSLYQVLHRTTGNESPRRVHQTQGQRDAKRGTQS